MVDPVLRDDNHLPVVLPKLKSFLFNHLLPALVTESH